MFRKAIFAAAVLGAALLAVNVSVSAQAPGGDGKGKGGKAADKGGKGDGKIADPMPQTVTKLKDNFYVVAGSGGNVGVRVTPQGLILVDSKNLGDTFYRGLMEAIRTFSVQPVKYVIITHHHQDHSGNIAKFEAAGAQVIAQENLKKNLETYAPAQGKVADPNQTYATTFTVSLAGAEARVYYYGKAHTSGDSFVYFPDLKILMTGDSAVGIAPNCDFPFGGSVVGWVKTLDQVLKLDFDTAVPGHSAMDKLTMTKADVQKFRDNMNLLATRGVAAVKAGTPKEKLLESIKTDDIGWNITGAQWNPPARLDPFYAELQAAAK